MTYIYSQFIPDHLMRYIFLLTFLLFTTPTLVWAQIDHWESVIREGDVFRYLEPASQPFDQWKAINFDDSQWPQGPSGFGYGDGDDNTLITNPAISVYLRRSFDIVDHEAIEAVLFHMDFDDGYVAYLNGTEIARQQVTGATPAFDQPADGLHEALLYQGLVPVPITLDPSALVMGTNVLAVEVHNESSNSSDLSAIPFLTVAINNPERHYQTTLSWFIPPLDMSDFSTNLPIVLITTTNDQQIPDEPKISAGMKIVRNLDGSPNTLGHAAEAGRLDYSGTIKIERRGSSSQALPKKSYGFTTYNASGQDKENVSLLDMPEENDWILNSLAFDPSLLRDYFSYDLARALGEYASRGQYCEVFINDIYQGLYVLQEKLKADDNRIDINKIDIDDNQLPELTGGYITKADKTTGGDPVAWTVMNSSGWTVDFIHEVPNPSEVTVPQHDYIRSVFDALTTTAFTRNSSLADGYPSLIDIPSFVDYIIVNELASNPDAYQYSTYFHKDRQGKLRAGPIWDLNLSFGNDLFVYGLDRSHTDIWQFENENTGATFWKSLFYDPEFNCRLALRWQQLRQAGAPLHLSTLEARIDQTILLFEAAIDREEATWQRVGDHASTIAVMKAWLRERLQWMDERLVPTSSCTSIDLPQLVISKIHYHPNSEEFDEDDLEFIEIANTGSAVADLTGIYFGGTGLVYQYPVGATLATDARLLLAHNAEVFEAAYGIRPFGEYTRKLSNKGQTIALLDGWGNMIDKVTYADAAPWPEEADGEGSYLRLTSLDEDNAQASAWTAAPVGSLVTALPPTSSLSIYPNPGDDHIIIQSESIIYSVLIMDIHGRQLHRAAPNMRRYGYPARTLPAGVYIVIVEDQHGITNHRIVIRN